MKILRDSTILLLALVACTAILHATVYVSKARQEKSRGKVLALLNSSNDAPQNVIQAIGRSPFWTVPERKDALYGVLKLGDARIKLFRPCKISVNGTGYVVSLELWTTLHQQKLKDEDSEDFWK